LVCTKNGVVGERRAAVESSFGHLKLEHRLERNRLKGVAGAAINAVLAAASLNFRKLLGVLWRNFLRCQMRIWSWIEPLQGSLPSKRGLQMPERNFSRIDYLCRNHWLPVTPASLADFHRILWQTFQNMKVFSPAATLALPKETPGLWRNQNRCVPKARPQSGFFLSQGSERWVLVVGVEVKAILETFPKAYSYSGSTPSRPGPLRSVAANA
jgi:hypothetical protein